MRAFQASAAASTAPTVTRANGTYRGLHNAYYDQVSFLGVPFAQPPVDNLRLSFLASLNTTFRGIRKAVAYGPDCPSGGLDDLGEAH